MQLVPPNSRARRILSPLAEFMQKESTGGVLMLGATIVALVWANTFADGYHGLWDEHLTLGPGSFTITEELRLWVNDALMAIFFFVVGLEIKRELVTGELRDPRTAALPAIAALGGMVVPAVIFAIWNLGGPGSDGWGIPMATDIAFAVGVIALLGNRVPAALKLFLLTLAIVDDLGAILVIAIFYSSGVRGAWLLGAVAVIALILVMQRLRVGSPLAYVLPALALWVCVFESGIHATIAGVALGLLTPVRWPGGPSPIERLEHRLLPVSSFVIVPLFALANAGVEVGGGAFGDALGSRVTWGVISGLVIGKFLGVSGATLLAARVGVGRLPAGVRTRHVLGGAAVAGIGFTVALFVSELSYRGSADLLNDAKIGVLLASVVSGAIGATILMRTRDSGPHRR